MDTNARLLLVLLALVSLFGMGLIGAAMLTGKPVEGSLIAITSGAAGALAGLAKNQNAPTPDKASDAGKAETK